MKKIKNNILWLFATAILSVVFVQCATPQSITAKTGVQLWGENCNRCHNTPTPTAFTDANWDVALNHMEIKANLTKMEAEKILEFLKSAN